MSGNLVESIKQLYNPPLSDEEAVEAKDNLVEFFKVLQEVDLRLWREREAEKKRKKGKKNQTLNQTKPSL